LDRLTRKELKTDRFAVEVQHSVEYMSDHRRQMIRWGGIGLAVLVIALAVYLYRQHTHTVRQEALFSALQVQNANVGPAQNEFTLTFPTQAEKDTAAQKAFTEVAAKYSGSDEGNIAEYYLAINAIDRGKTVEAEKRFKEVADSGNKDVASLAKLALAQIYGSEGKVAEGESLIRPLIDHPSATVSKEQATFALAHLLEKTKPQEARKLLEPLRSSDRGPISRSAVTALADMSQK
jgi:predicted negative regulator of RcsB-dependent stress response